MTQEETEQEGGGDFHDLMKIVTMGLSKENIKTFLEKVQKPLKKQKEEIAEKVSRRQKEKQKLKIHEGGEESHHENKKSVFYSSELFYSNNI